MSELPSYHQFMGNGIDAVLIGPSGAMSADPARGLDRCYWYKADLYYADERTYIEGQDPFVFAASPPGGTIFQLAPLARTWYEVLGPSGEPLTLSAAEQRFDPTTGALVTVAHFGSRRVELSTGLSETLPALCFDLRAGEALRVRARADAGLWPEDSAQSTPVSALTGARDGRNGLAFAVGDVTCSLHLVPAVTEACSADNRTVMGRDGRGLWADMTGTHVRWWTVLESSRYAEEHEAHLRLPAAPLPHLGLESHGPDNATRGHAIDIPDPDYARLHEFSMYMFRAIQHRHSGGIPVNNLRRTYNSHVFWDGAFVQRALLEAGHVAPAREAWRFLGRTRQAAAANARATFGSSGLHWDWETTHAGARAYVPFMHNRFQVHNTPLLAHMILADFRATRDFGALAEGYDLLAGAATFVLDTVLVESLGALTTRPLVGSSEAEALVVDDGATVAACLRLVKDVALAARILDRQDALSRSCRSAAARLRPALARLFNGRYFQATGVDDRLNTSSLAPMYPADIVSPVDPRALVTAQAYRERYAGRMAGHGNGETGFPWSAGVLARILAYQGRADAAWEQLDLARGALCAQGGSAEYVDEHGGWNMQYFSTAQATLCSAVHALLLQQHGAELRLFPAVPPAWSRCAFSGFLAAGLSLDASYEVGRVAVSVRNVTGAGRRALLRAGSRTATLDLAPGASRTLSLAQ